MSRRVQRQLTNAEIAELLARQSEHARQPAQRALRRASRKAFLWEEEASRLFRSQRSLTELSGVGPYIARLMHDWIAAPPRVPKPPPIRHGFITFPKARAALARQNGWLSGIKGDLQMHTVWSDGSSTIAEMASAAIERSYEYIAITDHSKGLKIAGGIDEVQLEQQAAEICSINAFFAAKGSKFRILRSIELNLNPEGVGDMSYEALNKLDIVLGCFHSALRKTDDQTNRYVAALRNPAVHILGHPRGRVYNFRLGLTANWPAIFEEAAALDKAVEIDGYPDRQDLSPDLVRLAAKAGCRVSLATDSHGASQLRFMEFSAASALLGGLKPERILNFMSAEELMRWVQSLRRRQALKHRTVRDE